MPAPSTSTKPLTTKLYTVEQAAKILSLSDRWVRKLCSEGRLGQRFGNKSFMITQDEIVAFKKLPRPVGNPDFMARKMAKQLARRFARRGI